MTVQSKFGFNAIIICAHQTPLIDPVNIGKESFIVTMKLQLNSNELIMNTRRSTGNMMTILGSLSS